MSPKAKPVTLDDLSVIIQDIQRSQKAFTKRFDKIDRNLNDLGIVVNGLSNVVHVLSHDLKDLREYTEAGFDTINNRFDYVDDRFEEIDMRMDEMDTRMNKMDDRFDLIDDRFDRLDEDLKYRFDRIDDRFDRLEASGSFYEH